MSTDEKMTQCDSIKPDVIFDESQVANQSRGEVYKSLYDVMHGGTIADSDGMPTEHCYATSK